MTLSHEPKFKADTLFARYCDGRADKGLIDGKINWQGWQRVADYVNQEAAAVSKNLQEERNAHIYSSNFWRKSADEVDRRALLLNVQLGKAESRILELESEITALRETK